MKQKNRSIKWRVLGYLIIFIIIMLVFLWLFQIVFLDNFYKSIKTKKIKNSALIIEENISNSDLQTIIDSISLREELNILIVDKNGEVVFESFEMPKPFHNKFSKIQLIEYFDKAVDNDGKYLEVSKQQAPKFEKQIPDRTKPLPDAHFGEIILYIKILNENKMILVNSIITPVDSTVETLRIQLVYISVIFIILSFILTFLISSKISKPIIKLNKQAKQLAEGNYSIKFKGEGYSEIQQLSDTLNHAATELSKTEALRRELIANISHDLRTPLTLIAGYGEAMKDLPGENTPENLQIIVDEANYLSELVSDMMDISKLQSGTDNLVIERFNITLCIKEILNRYTALIKQKGYIIEFESSEDIFVYGDKLKISQVIYNLINNALAYTGEDKKIIIEQSVKNNNAYIKVKDTGEGIDKNKLSYIWDRYYKIENKHRHSQIGTGLGLSIVKAIIDLHGSEIGVKSVLGKGSTFWFSLPTEK